ncbi:MAG: hypothetical protein KA419_18860 [Acidobacteria bacterium]|nr:hypothetical protein [Acidobacteriota bacterium]
MIVELGLALGSLLHRGDLEDLFDLERLFDRIGAEILLPIILVGLAFAVFIIAC